MCCVAGRLKEQGNAAFKAGQLKFARAKYTKALRLADRIFDIETEAQVLSSISTLPAQLCSSVKVSLNLYQQVLGYILCCHVWQCAHLQASVIATLNKEYHICKQ